MIGMLMALAAAGACDLPSEWTHPVPHVAAKAADMRFALKPGDAVRLTLSLPKAMRAMTVSDHDAKPGSFAGFAAIDVPRAGRLSIALSTATYVDLIRDGKVVPSVAHRRTAECPTLHKVVTFDVTPGRYIVQLSDAPERTVVMQATLG